MILWIDMFAKIRKAITYPSYCLLTLPFARNLINRSFQVVFNLQQLYLVKVATLMLRTHSPNIMTIVEVEWVVDWLNTL